MTTNNNDKNNDGNDNTQIQKPEHPKPRYIYENFSAKSTSDNIKENLKKNEPKE